MKNNIKKLLLFISLIITAVLILSFTSSAYMEKGFDYGVDSGKAYVYGYYGSSKSLTVPSKLGGYPVVYVGGMRNGSFTSVALPESVESIGDNAFACCTDLKTIKLPSKLKSIGSDAFYATAFFNNKNNWDSSGALYIGKYLIAVDTATTTFTIKSGTVTVAADAFEYCEGTKPASVGAQPTTAFTTAPAYDDGAEKPEAFKPSNKTELKTLKIPSSVRYIGAGAFNTCGSLTRVYAENSTSWFKINFGNSYANPLCYDSKLYFNGKIARDIVVPEGITKINDYALCGYERMKSIVLSDTVTTIGNYAFQGCESLQSIKLPKTFKSFGALSFNGCSSLESVYAYDIKSWLSMNFASVGSYWGWPSPMAYATKLYFGNKLAKNVVIPDGIKKINPGAFYSCECIESVKIPSSVTAVGENAFSDCYNLKTVYASDVASWCKIKFDSASSPTHQAKYLYFGKTLAKTVTIPSGVKKITYGAFVDLDCLETLIIPKTVTDINFYAFNGCKNLKTICYAGSKDDWYEIEFKHKADVYYNGLKRPSTPASLSASQSVNAINLKWGKTSGATGYAVYKYNSKTKKYEKIKTTTSNSFTVSKLSAGTKYKFAVRAYASKGGQTLWGAYSKEFETATKPATPSLSVSSASKGKATLSWTNVAGETGYQIYYSTTETSNFKKYSSPKANTTKATISGLTSGKTYYFRVRAYIKTGSGTVFGSYKTVSAKIK